MSLLSNQELEERLTAAGKSLLQPPSTLDELLKLLDRIEELLSKVAQSPARSMQNALSPVINALISQELLKHSDVDVEVGVAACISEITRITAPDAPYDDDKMKDIFQLIVSSFEKLSDTSSRSYQKRTTVLETVSKVRSCVIMLDLELDQMIIEMFQHFLKSIREHHPEAIFASMEAIMTLVLEESEYISPNLLNPILDVLKKSKADVPPISRKLAARVIQNGADKLNPCLEKAVNALNASLDDYDEVVASVCQKNSNSLGHSDENIIKDQSDVQEDIKPQDKVPNEDVKEEIKPRDKDPTDDVMDEVKPQEKDPAVNGSAKSIACNSIDKTGDEETATDESFSKKVVCTQQVKSTSETESDDMGAQEPAQLEVQVDLVANGEAKPFKCKNNSAESTDVIDEEKLTEQVPSHQETPNVEIHTLTDESPPVEADKPLATVKGATTQVSPLKESEIEAVNVEPPIQRDALPDEKQTKRSGRTKRKGNMGKEDTGSKKASESANIGEVNKKQRTMKKQHGVPIKKDKALNEGVLKNDAGSMSDSEAKNLVSKELGDNSNKKEDGSLQDGVRKGGRVRPKSEKDTSESSATGNNEKDTEALVSSPVKSAEDEVSQEETPKIGTKRKRPTSTENTPQTIKYGKNLVGSKVKVWWPDDDEFYEGVIASFNPFMKKHKVEYTDGDVEVLDLKNERWEFVGDNPAIEGGKSAEHPSQDAFSNKKKKKGNANPETSNKREKMDDPPKRKPKANVTKSSKKSKDDSKAEPGPGSENSEDEADNSEEHSNELEGKSPEHPTKASGKSRDSVARTSSSKKQDNQRSASSKGKTPQSKGKTPQTKGKAALQSGKTVSPAGKGVKKPGLSKAKGTPRTERAMDSEKLADALRAVKSQEGGSKSGKKKRK